MFPKTTKMLFETKVGQIQVDVYAMTYESTSLHENIVKLLEELAHYIEKGIKIYEVYKDEIINDEIIRNTLQAHFQNLIFPDVDKLWYHAHVACSEVNNPPSQLDFLPIVEISLKRVRSISRVFLTFKPLTQYSSE